MSIVYLALGSNVGEGERQFAFAAEALQAGGVKIVKKSRIRRTAPVDCPPGTPDFFNAVWRCEYAGSPLQLLNLCQKTEIASGRPANHGFHTPRTLDIDLIDFEGVVMQSERLTLPHPRAAQRDFVRIPLDEVRL